MAPRFRYDRAINSVKAATFREHLLEMDGHALFLQEDAITDMAQALYLALEELRGYHTYFIRHIADFPCGFELRDAAEVVKDHPLAVYGMQEVVAFCDTCKVNPLDAHNPLGRKNGAPILNITLDGKEKQ